MLRPTLLRLGVITILLLFADITVAQVQENNEVSTFSVSQVVSYEEFNRLREAGMIHPPTEEELRQAESGRQDDSSPQDSVDWMDIDESDFLEIEPEDEPEEEDVFMVVEVQPEYPGGYQAMRNFIKQNLKYPRICMENNIQGRVLVSFIVDKDGSIVEPEIVKSVNPSLDKEALRLVSIMPKWNPGSQRGKPVRVKYTMPLTFSLGGGSTSSNMFDSRGDFVGINSNNNENPTIKGEQLLGQGLDYYTGQNGHSKDLNRAYDLFNQAAGYNNATAMYLIGAMYEAGYGVKQDYNRAHEWYLKSANQKYSGAQFALGNMYLSGNEAIKQDKEKALEWYRLALENGYKNAEKQIAMLENATKRIALIIGNADYPKGRLANPVNDAQDLAVKLKSLGFDVIGKTNLDLQGMNEAIAEFCEKASDYDAALFFYAGHAVQNEGINYLMPARSTVDAASITNDCINMNSVLAQLDATDVKSKIIILDACRDNGLQSLTRGASDQGLAKMSCSGSAIMFSTQAGMTAKDGKGERNSPFTTELLKQLDKPNVPLYDMFKEIQTNVSNKTRKEQIPSINDDLVGTFYFNVKL